MSDSKSTEEILLNRVNELNSTVKQLNTERQQLLNTIESQQQTISFMQQSIALKDVEISDLKKLNNAVNTQVKTPVEQEVKPLEEQKVKTPEELHQSIVKKFLSVQTRTYRDQSGGLCLVEFKKLDDDEVKYVCDYFSVVAVDSLGDGTTYWHDGDLDKFSRESNRVVMLANKFNTKAREFLKSVEVANVKIDKVLDEVNRVILDSIKKINFEVSNIGNIVVVSYDAKLNKCQIECIKNKLGKQVWYESVSGKYDIQMSFAELYTDFANMMGYTDEEKRVKLAV